MNERLSRQKNLKMNKTGLSIKTDQRKGILWKSESRQRERVNTGRGNDASNDDAGLDSVIRWHLSGGGALW